MAGQKRTLESYIGGCLGVLIAVGWYGLNLALMQWVMGV